MLISAMLSVSSAMIGCEDPTLGDGTDAGDDRGPSRDGGASGDASAALEDGGSAGAHDAGSLVPD
ncbi:MAG: hypothetical protein M3Y87_23080, partial [Myxococcota bacterium]|nr:hypothetical protein [Myxococcota bacterium]